MTRSEWHNWCGILDLIYTPTKVEQITEEITSQIIIIFTNNLPAFCRSDLMMIIFLFQAYCMLCRAAHTIKHEHVHHNAKSKHKHTTTSTTTTGPYAILVQYHNTIYLPNQFKRTVSYSHLVVTVIQTVLRKRTYELEEKHWELNKQPVEQAKVDINTWVVLGNI